MEFEHPRASYNNEKAEEIARILNENEPEGWTYVVRNIPKNPRFSFIEIYDEENEFAGYFYL